MALGLIVVAGALEEVWTDRVVVEWEGRRVPVGSRAELLTMKRMAGRPKDLLDIAALEGGSEDKQ